MQKHFKQYIVFAILVSVLIPSFALAAWWNPFSWGIWNRIFHFQRQEQKQEQQQNQDQKLGGDRDEHGCIGSAGYTWCEAKQKCLRQWEEKCEAAPADPTAGWKTYDRGDGFEFKYPKEWVVDTKTADMIVTISIWSSESEMQKSIDPKNAGLPPIYPEFSISYRDLPSFNKFAKDLVGKEINNAKDFVSSYSYFNSFAEINVGNTKAYAVISVANRAVYTVYIESVNRVYILSAEDLSRAGYDPKNPKLDPNISKIISTFKFTTPADPTAGWKTHTNTEYGFEIKHPANWKFSDNYGILFYPAEYEKEALSCYGGPSMGGCNAHKISIVVQPYTSVESYWLWNIIANKSNIKAPLKMPVDDQMIKDSKTVNLGGNKVVEVIDGFGSGSWQRNYFVIDSPEKESLIIFHSENNKNPISIVNIAEVMLSTFKFTK